MFVVFKEFDVVIKISFFVFFYPVPYFKQSSSCSNYSGSFFNLVDWMFMMPWYWYMRMYMTESGGFTPFPHFLNYLTETYKCRLKPRHY